VSKIGELRDLLVALLQEHERDNALPTSARFLFYELVTRKHINKAATGRRRADQDMIDALTDIREDGRISWDAIVDETRSLNSYTGDQTIKQGVLGRLPYIKLDPWRGRIPVIITESRSLAGVLRSVVVEYSCRIASVNGQCAGFLHTKLGPALNADDAVLYLGDLDFSGGHIEANTRRVLEQIVGPLEWKRLAVTKEQVERYNLEPIQKWDERTKSYHDAVETEALSQSVLVQMLRYRLGAQLPEPLERVQERAKRQRRHTAALLQRRR
jgi:hypothetical protein